MKNPDGTSKGFGVVADSRDRQMWMYAFETKQAAEAAFTAINRFAFTQECYFERTPASMSFTYFKAE